MPITLKCNCGQTLKVADSMAGKTGKCPKCQSAVKIPAEADMAAMAALSPTPKAGASQAKPTPPSTAKSAASPKTGSPTTQTVAKGPAKPGSTSAAKSPSGAARAATPSALAGGPPAVHIDQLFDDIGLKKKSGPMCPKCGVNISASAALCTHCGYHLQTGEQADGFNIVRERDEFNNSFLQEAANNMNKEVVSGERHAKVGMPWWMLASFLFGALCIGSAGVIIVDGAFSEKAPAGTFLGDLQRQKLAVVAGFTFAAVGSMISTFAHLSIVIFAFQQSIGKGFGALLIPLFSFVYGCMTWADNKSGIIGIFIGAAVSGGGLALLASA